MPFWLAHTAPWYLTKYYFEVCPCRCFWMRWALSPIDWVKWIALPCWQELSSLLRAFIGQKGEERETSLSLSAWLFEPGHWSSLAFGLRLIPSMFLVQKQEYMSTIAHTFMHSAPQELFLFFPLPSSFSIGPKQWKNKHFGKKINLQISLSFIQNFSKTLNVWQSFFLQWTRAV